MVERDDDPLAALQRAFDELQPPVPQRALGDEDASTRAVVGWARGAYDGLQPPAPVLRLRESPRSATTARSERGQRWRRHAAAAALLLGLGLALRSRPELRPRPPSAEPVDSGPRLVAVADDHLVMRSGNVRLVLITSNSDAPALR
ncbi:MAG: hypothetical protein DRQ55_15380 [Planctomycetota bacterium]|nr:MAG: hypothetical protein DRQ55_15380 [Planctomycetota bacterium]